MSDLPEMPEVEAGEGEIDRHDAHYRLNPGGHRELVVKKKGKSDEETLNELADNLIALANESIAFGGPAPAMSPEQQGYQRNVNNITPQGMADNGQLLTRSDAEETVTAGESPNNLTSSTEQQADGPERSRVKSRIGTRTTRGIGPRNKYIAGRRSDGITHSATYDESFTGTAAIAIGPYDVLKSDDEDNEDIETSESLMTKASKVLNEWEPKFAGGGDYSPGDYQMPSPKGDGVAERKPTKDKVGKFDTETSESGKEWPRKFSNNLAMSSVDNNGVDGSPQGHHESTHAEASDGHQTAVSHNWPDEPKNDGSGVAEPFEGERWSDGGTLKDGSGADEEHFKAGGPGMPSSGTITGTSGPQYGEVQESWTPDLFSTLMEGEINLQDLFDAYAASGREAVCMEDFQMLARANGSDVQVDQQLMLDLMKVNKQFMFYEGTDAHGPYWVPNAINEDGKPFPGAAAPFGSDDSDGSDSDDSDSDSDGGSGKPWESGSDSSDDSDCDSDCDDSDSDSGGSGKPWEKDTVEEGNSRRPFFQPINELAGKHMNVRDPRKSKGALGAGGLPDMGMEDPMDLGVGSGMGEMDDMGMGGMEGDLMDMGDDMGMGGMEADCIDCEEEDTLLGDDPMGQEDPMGAGPMGAGPMGAGPMGAGPKKPMRRKPQPKQPSAAMSFESVYSPKNQSALVEFMKSARSIIGNNKRAGKNSVAEALNHSWDYYTGGLDPRTCPTKVRKSLISLMEGFPGFQPLVENEAMDSADGSAIGGGGSANNKSSFLPESESDTTDEGEAWPRSHKTQKSPEETPIMKGTEKGMTGTGNSQTVKENVAKLSRLVKSSITEGSTGLNGKYDIQFTILVQENNGKLNRTSPRIALAEALADAEELLQVYPADQVVLESYFGKNDQCLRKYDIPMVPVKSRGPLVSGDMALFRFSNIAESYADNLVAEGYTCKVGSHSWGRAVKVMTESRKWASMAKSVKPTMTEARRTPVTA